MNRPRIPHAPQGATGALVALAAALALLMTGGCPPPEERPIRVSVNSTNDNGQRSPAEVLELAKAEGELYWYTSLPEADAEAILSQFRAKYPFIRTHLVRGGSFTIAEQVANQIASGRVQADVLHLLDPATFVQLREQRALLYYDSPEARDIPSQYKDLGYWVALRAVTLGLAYDPRRLRGEKVPKGWEDLLRPAFQGRIGIKDAETAGAAYALLFLLRERYGTIYWQRLAAQKPRVFKTVAQMEEALLQGEIDIAAGDVEEKPTRGAGADGLAVVWPAEGVPMMVGPIGILAGAAHPNCAKLFVDYALSTEGQALLVKQVADYSLRPDLPAPEGRAPLAKMRLLLPTAGWADYAAKRELLRKEFSDLMGTGGE